MKIFSIAFLLLMLSGCGLFGAKIEDNRPPPVLITNKTLLAYSCPPPPQVDNITPRDIQWRVISRKKLDAMLLETLSDLDIEDETLFIVNQAAGDFFFMADEAVVWVLSADDYANLGRNVSDVLAALKQMKKVAIHYKKCIADSEQAVLDQNSVETPE